jgi:hypothetical protein
MNRKAGIGETLKDNLIYLILLLLFTVPIFFFIQNQMNGASVWSDYYAKEITKVVNSAQPGDEITLIVHKATEIAKKNNVGFSEVFEFNNVDKEICIKLSRGKKSCYSFFNNVDLIDKDLKLGVGKDGKNILKFKIAESRENG